MRREGMKGETTVGQGVAVVDDGVAAIRRRRRGDPKTAFSGRRRRDDPATAATGGRDVTKAAAAVPRLLEILGLAELEHDPRNNRMRAR